MISTKFDKETQDYLNNLKDDLNYVIDTKQNQAALLIGNIRSINQNNIAKHNIKAVLSITEQPIHLQSPYLDHHQILAKDNDHQDLTSFFKQAVEFITKQMYSKKQNVLVHCQMGASRSAAIVICFLCCKLKMRINQAVQYLKSRRPITSTRDTFLNQIKTFIRNHSSHSF